MDSELNYKELVLKVKKLENEISNFKQTEKNLPSDEHCFHELFNNMYSGVIIYGAIDDGSDFVIKEINPAAERIDNITREVIGKSALKVFPGLKQCGYWDVYRRVWKTGVAEYLPARLYKDNRISYWGENYFFKLPSGELVSVHHDVSDQKLAEKALRESEQHFRAVVENSLTGISIVREGKVVYQNPEQRNLSRSITELFFDPDYKFIYPDDVAKIKFFHQKIVARKQQNFDVEFRFYSDDDFEGQRDKVKDNLKWVHCRANLVNFHGEEAILINLMDITETKEMERLLLMQDKMASLGRVAAGIAHEIRNPLSGINIYLNALEMVLNNSDNQGLNKMIMDIAGQMKSSSDKIESVIRRVMDFCKKVEPYFVLLDINKPIEEAIKLIGVSLRKNKVSFSKYLEKNLSLCRADPNLIEQVVLILINNASEAMRNTDGPKQIKVSSNMVNNHIIVRVSDSGSGIPLNLRDKIFDPFYTTKKYGTGIGLSICQRIIMDHNGSLTVTCSKWGGAEFIVKIPIENGENQK